MTGKWTKTEFRRKAWQAILANDLASLTDLVVLAEESGAEWLPEQVEPVVGELLTEATRLVHRMAVVKGCVVWQYDHAVLVWRNAIDDSTISALSKAHSQLLGGRIVLVPSSPLTLKDYAGEPATEQNHETELDHTPAGVKAHCLTCGWRSGLYPFADDARKVAAGHVAVQS